MIVCFLIFYRFRKLLCSFSMVLKGNESFNVLNEATLSSSELAQSHLYFYRALGMNTTAKVHIDFSTADNRMWNFCPHQRESFQRGNSNSVTLHVRWAVFLVPEWDPHGLLLNIYFHVWHREPDSSIGCGEGRKLSCSANMMAGESHEFGQLVQWEVYADGPRREARVSSESSAENYRIGEFMHKSNRHRAVLPYSRGIGQTKLGLGKGEEQKTDLFRDKRDCICFRDIQRGNVLVWMSRLHKRSQD